MEALTIIYGFMCPLIAIGIVGIFYGLYDNKRRRA